jgi:phosphatidylethanolamine/phosphatidyl-N-methylethanolamine N-methyltransferase
MTGNLEANDMSRRNLSTKEKYDRMARSYDLMEIFPETLFFGRFRKTLFAMVRGETLLEVGVGTGKNIPYYPRDMHVTAVDFSPEMLRRAQRRAEKVQAAVTLRQMDIEALQFEAGSFDAVVSTFVFCSVPHPRYLQDDRGKTCAVDGGGGASHSGSAQFRREHWRADVRKKLEKRMSAKGYVMSGVNHERD